MGHDDDDSWRALCAFAKNPHGADDPREPWEFVTTRPKPKQTRKRKMTLARALRQADKAGVAVRNAVVKPDGVELQLSGETPDQPNPWDSVQ
jgi:hypothetical protein